MKSSKLSLLLVGLLVAVGTATVQAQSSRPESGDGPNAVVRKDDPNAPMNKRADVKAAIPKAAGGGDSEAGPRGDKKMADAKSSKTRAEVKADKGTAKKMPESMDGPTAKEGKK